MKSSDMELFIRIIILHVNRMAISLILDATINPSTFTINPSTFTINLSTFTINLSTFRW